MSLEPREGAVTGPMTAGLGQKYLPISWIENRWATGELTDISLQQGTDVSLIINPRERYLGLRVEASGFDFEKDQTGIGDLRNLRLRQEERFDDAEKAIVEVLVDGSNLTAPYYFLRNIATLIQQYGVSPVVAIRDSVSGFRELLQGFKMVSQATEIGLLGEVMVLRHLVRSGLKTVDEAVAAWLGPLAEEHDFTFATCDIEVKTTSSEERSHIISSLSQLQATLGKNLLFASLQVTKTAEGGETLMEAIDGLRSQLHDAHAVELLETKLARVGIIAENQHLYTTRWLLRTPIAFYNVDTNFPRLSGDFDERISNISYRISLGGLPELGSAVGSYFEETKG
ncbi:PD-(D/E)XK motif protein [Corynebacterium hindlerae]|uniref:PD-(D/E)XK motif protein n=1 Tax=Corynebacterium hindlerae TaxID=699041 RepID=UPI0031B678DB